jgi:zinc transport system ATP-binding protein
MEDISVRFGDRMALDHIRINLPTGSFLAIIGPNGSGKSTLIKTILGLIRPTEGKLTLDKVRSIGYVPQIKTHDRTFPATSIDLVASGLLQRWPWKVKADIEHRALDALSRINAQNLAYQSPARLSGGELQRVYLARALARDPDLLVLDEPATGIDLRGEESIHHSIEAVRDNARVTVVMVTHDLTVAYHHASHVLVLNSKQIAFGLAEEVLTDDVLRVAFGHVGHTHAMGVKPQ